MKSCVRPLAEERNSTPTILNVKLTERFACPEGGPGHAGEITSLGWFRNYSLLLARKRETASGRLYKRQKMKHFYCVHRRAIETLQLMQILT